MVCKLKQRLVHSYWCFNICNLVEREIKVPFDLKCINKANSFNFPFNQIANIETPLGMY